MSSLRVVNVVGCRPNFMKVAPLVAEMRRQGGLTPIVVHTGQHHGWEMSDVFFKDLDLLALRAARRHWESVRGPGAHFIQSTR